MNDLLQPCANSATPLHGEYCHACGEKRIIPEKDFSVGYFTAELWGVVQTRIGSYAKGTKPAKHAWCA